MLTGKQLRKFTAGEVTVPTLAMTPVSPGAFEVATPLASTDATLALFCVQPIWPTELVMSLELGAQKPVESGGCTWVEQACALNVNVCLTEKQVLGGGPSTTMEVTTGCTAIWIGALVTPAAEAVIVAVPAIGLPCASVPLHTTKVESHTPPHTSPLGETVATEVLVELNVKVVVTAVPVEFVAAKVSWTTCPATSEGDDTFRVTWNTWLGLGLGAELCPQPPNNAADTIRNPVLTTQDRMPPPRAGSPERYLH
jgi:hypothetical protein